MENYEQYSIYQLREIARRMGVKAPTTKRKNVLIEEMEKIKNNSLEPVYSINGRPCKKHIENICIVSDSLPKDILINIVSKIDELKKYIEKHL